MSFYFLVSKISINFSLKVIYMRKLFLFPAVLMGILVVFQSCSKQSSNNTVAPMRTNIINATIAPNGSYQLSVDNSGTVSISKQASHFQVSQIEPDSKSGLIVYKYIPAVDYRGIDEVVLSNTKTFITGSSGCPGNHTSNSDNTTSSTSYTTVKINITN
jgi:hypothetical protein